MAMMHGLSQALRERGGLVCARVYPSELCARPSCARALASLSRFAHRPARLRPPLASSVFSFVSQNNFTK